MKKTIKAALLLLAVLTVIYVGAVAYASANHNNGGMDCSGVVYAAVEYESTIPPSECYKPEQLGIVKIMEYEGDWLHIVVNQEKEPFPLQRENPIFQYEEKFYQVSSLWFTPSLPKTIIRWQVPIGGALGAAWICTGILLLKGSDREPFRGDPSVI